MRYRFPDQAQPAAEEVFAKARCRAELGAVLGKRILPVVTQPVACAGKKFATTRLIFVQMNALVVEKRRPKAVEIDGAKNFIIVALSINQQEIQVGHPVLFHELVQGDARDRFRDDVGPDKFAETIVLWIACPKVIHSLGNK